jgi:tetratricopeptide (TPR) repeat protein
MSELLRLFELACDLPPAQREAALREAGVDAATIREVLDLIDADARTATYGINSVIAGLNTTELHAGDVLGPWRLAREIGHGGMGAVYLAERADGHFKQQAAVKLIRGIADDEAARRFAQERQTLADLQHPQIARLLDGGATPGGAPYLVMEYVEGVLLDDWCSAANPGLDARLRILVSICKTLQFAHQRLIVHCDLKPSNVLVRGDGVPVLLDFGIARALDQADTDAGRHSYLTPRYASPEQARGEKPTIASDVYSLGLLLYRLTADTAPPVLDAANPQPPVPSATQNAPAWRSRLRGDIDAIVARACAVDPAKRYSSTQALAEDIERIAAHRPVFARRQSLAYVGSRLIRRYWPVFAGVALMFVLAAGFTWRIVAAEKEAHRQATEAQRQATLAQRTADFLVSVFAASDAGHNDTARHDLTAREVLDTGATRIRKELADDPATRARLLEAIGNAYRHMDLYDKAAPLLREAADINLGAGVNQPLEAARDLEELTNTLTNGDFPAEDALRTARESLQLRQKAFAPDSQEIANSLMVLSLAYDKAGRFDEAVETGKATLAINEKLDTPTARLRPALNNLGMFEKNRGDYAESWKYYERALDLDRTQGRAHTAGYANSLNTYAQSLDRGGKPEQAIAAINEAIAVDTEIFSAESSTVANDQRELARMLIGMGRYSEAMAPLDSSLATTAKVHGTKSTEYASVLFQVSNFNSDMGRYAAAIDAMRVVYDLRRERMGADDLRTTRAGDTLGSLLVENGDANEEARSLLDAAITTYAKSSPDSVDLPYPQLALAHWYLLRDDTDAASVLLDRVEAPGAKSNYWVRAHAAELRAQIAAKQGKTDEAVHDYERAFHLMRDKLGEKNPKSARSGLLYARSLRAVGRGDEAAALEKELQPIFDAAFPADSAFRRELFPADPPGRPTPTRG